MNIARVFSRRTNATPDDPLAFTAPPPKDLLKALDSGKLSIDEVHVSAAFTYDVEKAEALAGAWSCTGVPVKLGGPAYDVPGEDFVPGRYLKPGFVITSRGCDRSCWFCSVPRREGSLRELPVTNGSNVLDDNLLACSEDHIRKVFAMLKTQPKKPVFTGGLEAARLRPWHVELLREVKAARIYFACDTFPKDYEPLVEAGKLLRGGGITKASHRAACYVLIGFSGDTMERAERRLRAVWDAGFVPYAMLYRDNSGKVDSEWSSFQRSWLRPAMVMARLKAAA